jgi:hypothetical protein
MTRPHPLHLKEADAKLPPVNVKSTGSITNYSSLFTTFGVPYVDDYDWL